MQCECVQCIFRSTKCDGNFASFTLIIEYFSDLIGGPKSQKLDLHISNLNAFQPNNGKKLQKLHMNFLVWALWESLFDKVVLGVANCDHQESKLCAVAGAKGF